MAFHRLLMQSLLQLLIQIGMLNLYQRKLVESVKASGKIILGVEGKVESGWILVDCGEVVINIMKSDIRDFYDLEGLWGENTLLNNSN